MNVYLLWDGAYEDRNVVGAYDSLEAAQAVAHGHKPRWTALSENHWRCEWTLRHHRAQVPIDIHFDTLTIPVVDGKATLPDGRVIESTSPYIDVPVLPPGTDIRPAQDWTNGCVFEIEAVEVHATSSIPKLLRPAK